MGETNMPGRGVMEDNEERDRKDEQEVRKGVFGLGLLFLSALSLLVVHCRTLSPSLLPSFHLSDRQLLADSLSVPDSTQAPRFLRLLPNMLLYFTSLLSLPSSSPQFTRSES